MSNRTIAQLTALIPQCMRRDQHRFRQSVKNLQRDATGIDALAAKIAASIQHRQTRLENLPAQNYPEELPVSQRRDDIAAAIRDHQVVIVAGETGSGKTTQLPKICLGLGRGVAGFIGHTQPRRLAARSVATRIAEELGTPLGEAVGYKVRFSDHTKTSSYIKLMTDGILLAELQGDRFLDQYDTLIIDEAHERSLNIDFLLGYLKQLLPKRKDLKVIITSATIDTRRFSQHFNHAPVIEVSGRNYPVEIRYQHADEEETEPTDAILAAVDELAQLDGQKQGDILIFLSGERDIRELADALRKHHPHNTEVLPLYSRLSANEQNRVFKPGKQRRIVLATNVAETSITVPGIRYVIDPGTARISRYSYRSKVQRLPVEKIAQSSANQRAGRCGRLSDGICIRLYSEEDFLARPLFTQPEIQRTNLAAVILQMRQLGLGDPADFPFIDPPDQRFINDGFRLLLELNAINEKRQLTSVGQRLAKLPIDPRLGRMILAAEENNCLTEVLIIVSVLSVQDPRERPVEKQQQADEKHKRLRDEQSDFISMLNLWREYNDRKKHLTQNKLRQYCKQEFLSYTRMREWLETFQQLKTLSKGMGLKTHSSPAEYAAIHQSLVTGLLGNIGVKNTDDNADEKKKGQAPAKRKKISTYLGARQSTFHIFPGSGLAKNPPHWLMSAELVETSRLFARQNAYIEPEWIEAAAQHLVKRTYSEPHWNPKRGIVMADETVTLYGLVVYGARRVNYGPIDPEVARSIFIREALVEGNYRTQAAFFAHNRALIEEACSLESKTRRQDVLVDDAVLCQFFDEKLPVSVRDHVTFEQWRKKIDAKTPDLLRLTREDVFRSASASPDTEYPGEMLFNDISLQLKYCFSPGSDDDGVTAVIPLASINQFRQAQFDYLVPGFLAEKITALLKGLPKSLRKQLVPVPETVKSALVSLAEQENAVGDGQSLLDNLAGFLKKEKALVVTAKDWRLEQLPLHLLMRFDVVDHQQKSLGVSRSLIELQSRFGEHAAKEMAQVQSDVSWPDDGLTSWQFGDLPEFVMVTRGEQQYRAYPAIVDKGVAVGVELFDAPVTAMRVHTKGLRRLAMLENAKAVKYLLRQMPKINEMCLVYSVFAPAKDLQNDLLELILDQCFFEKGYAIHQQETFSAHMQQAEALMPTANEICKLVAKILIAYQSARQQFQSMQGSCHQESHQDIQTQLDTLLYAGFLTCTPYLWLQEMPRYFRALTIRLNKLADSPAGDENKLQLLRPFLQEYTRLQKTAEDSAEIIRLRWMLEEYRVSLFAQPMKTAVPVSPKRIEKQIRLCQ
ncbi:MAG: ATP-dependent RNA helicase HrpA [Gammaproteobacteria bacterium]|nr:ATP-dependent RNA helicase HrpA [Gammaproteobacteria bacterium]